MVGFLIVWSVARRFRRPAVKKWHEMAPPRKNLGVNVSLDDIIRNRHNPRGGPLPRKWTQLPSTMDVRNKIIVKKRSRIKDARDKLVEMAKNKDARLKLEQLRSDKAGRGFINKARPPVVRPKFKGRPNWGLFSDTTRQVQSAPLRPVHRVPRLPVYNSPHNYMNDVEMEEEYVPQPLKPIIRSINNDLEFHSRSPGSSDYRSPVPLKDKLIVSEGRNLKIVARNNDAHSRNTMSSNDVVYVNDDDVRIAPVSILKKRTSGAGKVSPLKRISDASPADRRPSNEPTRKQEGYRIVVSNLQTDVTSDDIYELFVDIGELTESRLVRPGTAEVIYNSLKDARNAVEVYHNRQLDGQPMKCFLVNPKNPPHMTEDNVKSPRPGRPFLPASSDSSVEPDISTFHKVLFRKY